ncbi:hypothetical protein HPP92_027937 [Vanilla planifolia]|uniref:Uncharacterized protein n=1 Tax=Vanilla planifolia TaxID=51239 RepID=A0A835U6V0_VANPL|nr:hypothetical protein HPP92_027937 [Vanilla planifolia]
MYNPKTGYAETLNQDIDIVVPEDDYGLHAIDILDPAWVSPKCKKTLVNKFYISKTSGRRVLGDIDFKEGAFKGEHDARRDSVIASKKSVIHKRILGVLEESLEKKKILQESYGRRMRSMTTCLLKNELVTRAVAWLRESIEAIAKIFVKYVNKWICIACPFQGAPGCINDSLLTGMQFVEGFKSFFFVSRWTMHQLLTYHGESFALPFNLSILNWASRTRQILDVAQLPDNVDFYNIYGISYDTPHNVCYGSEASPIDDLSEICHTMPEYSYVDGDGTVPADSAMADGFAAKARIAVKAQHRALLSDKTVLKLLKQWLGVAQYSQQSGHSQTAKVVDAFPELIPV